MPTTKDTKQAVSMGLTLEEMYDFLMVEIEPDLTTVMIPHIDEMYEGETEKENKKRIKRYKKAFTKFEKKFKKALKVWKKKFVEVREDILSIVKEKVKKEDAEKLSQIERSISES